MKPSTDLLLDLVWLRGDVTEMVVEFAVIDNVCVQALWYLLLAFLLDINDL